MDDQADWLDQKYETLPDRRRLAIAFESLSGPNGNGSLALLNRCQARLQREYQRTLKTLTDLQAARLAAQSKLSRQQKLPNEPKPFPEPPAERPAALPVVLHVPDQPAPPLDVEAASACRLATLLEPPPSTPSARSSISCVSLRCR